MIECHVKYLWRCLNKKGVSHMYIRVIKDMYERGRINIRTPRGVTNDLYVSMASIRVSL